MEYRKFGGSGLTVSRMCLGTGQFGQQIDEDTAKLILARAADSGINFIDTADSYPAGAEQGKLGNAERIVGRWLSGRRHEFILGTKVGSRVGACAWNAGNSRKHIMEAIDASLQRLNTDYVDLYQLHADDPATPLDETVEAMGQLVRSGKVRYLGVSNFLAFRLAKALGRQEFLHLARFVSVQPRYNLLHREIERELLPFCVQDSLAVLPYNPLAGGLLTGKYSLNDTPDHGRFSPEVGSFGSVYQARYWHQREFEVVEQVRQLADQSGVAPATLSIAWVLNNPAITSVILGATRVQQLTDTLGALNFSLDDDVRTKLDEVSIGFRKGDAERWV